MLWFQKYVGSLDVWVYYGAATRGSLGLIKWLMEKALLHYGGVDVCKKVSEEGHLHILKWLREQGFEWCSWVRIGATHTGDLEMMQWLHNSDYLKTPTHYRAAEHDQKKVLIMFRENGYQNNRDWSGAASGACSAGHHDLLKWLLEEN